jgi:hypothetical protein
MQSIGQGAAATSVVLSLAESRSAANQEQSLRAHRSSDAIRVFI